MPDEPIVAEPVAEPVADPVADPTPEPEPEPEPAFVWDFPTYEPPAVDQEPELSDEDQQRIANNVLMQSVNTNASMQRNLTVLMNNLKRNGASEDVILAAQEEFWNMGVGAIDPRSAEYAANLAYGKVARQGKPTTKPKPVVRAPSAAPVGNIPQKGVDDGEYARAQMAADAFNRELPEGMEKLKPEDFLGGLG